MRVYPDNDVKYKKFKDTPSLPFLKPLPKRINEKSMLLRH